MRRLILLQHLSLDGFAGTSRGELNWINHSEEQFDFVKTLTDKCDTAIYGRKTYELMEAYWPTAADKPDATKHDKEHSVWYAEVDKYIISSTMKDVKAEKRHFISEDIAEEIGALKEKTGKNLLLLGSPSVSRILTSHNLIDEFWFFLNPVILGTGISPFPEPDRWINLEPIDTRSFPCGVTALHLTLDKHPDTQN